MSTKNHKRESEFLFTVISLYLKNRVEIKHQNHSLLRRYPNHFFNLSSKIMKICEQILRRAPRALQYKPRAMQYSYAQLTASQNSKNYDLDLWWCILNMGQSASTFLLPSCGSLSASLIRCSNSSRVGSINSHPSGGGLRPVRRTFGILHSSHFWRNLISTNFKQTYLKNFWVTAS